MAWKEMTWDYVAGFFDGEGCINCRAGLQSEDRYIYRRWRCIFYQNDRAVLDEISEFLSKEGIPSVVRNHQPFRGKEMSKTLDIGGAVYTYKFLLKVEPYLRVKHDQAFDVINELEELMIAAEQGKLGSPRANSTYKNLRAVN